MMRISSKFALVLICVFVTASLFAGVGPFFIRNARGAQVVDRSLMLSNNEPGAASSYQSTFTLPTADLLGSIKIEFCSNTALFEVTCNAPAGFDITIGTLTEQSGETGFIIDPLTYASNLILSRLPSPTAGGVTISFTVTGVQNATDPGSQFARYSTYATNDTTGLETDRGSVAYVLNEALSISAEVPPFLEYCLGITITNVDCGTAEGNYINMGNFTPSTTSSGQTQMVLGTNAANGYSIRVNGSTLNSGNNGIAALSTPTLSAPGISQFGINLRANTIPSIGSEPAGNGVGQPQPDYNQVDKYTYRSGDIIASHNDVEDYRKFTVTYLVNIARSQSPGVYSSTFTYTATGNF